MNKFVLLAIVAFGGLILITTSSDKDVAVQEDVVMEVQTIPSDIPSVPIYPGVNILSVNDTDSDKSRDVSLSLEVNAPISKINEWYAKALSEGGWTIKSNKNVGGYQIIQGENANLYTSMQAANGDEAGSVIISQHIKVRK